MKSLIETVRAQGQRSTIGLLFTGLVLASCGRSPDSGSVNTTISQSSPATATNKAADPAPSVNSTTQPDPCAGASTQLDMNTCAANEYQKADQRLTVVYHSFKPVSDKLRASERAWISYRDAECAFAGEYVQGGSMQPMVIANCMTDLTNERIKTLQGDLSDLNQ
jgi:uncharacterized protein YecT (DUF1311 family)